MRQGLRQRLQHIGARSVLSAAIFLAAWPIRAQQPDAAVVNKVDAMVHARFDSVASFTVTEHYAVFRSGDETHPAAEMTVKTTYRKDTGKSYEMVSESGSTVIRKFGLEPLLENEKRVNDPANREASWFTTANYEMKLKTGVTEQIGGIECVALEISPKQKAPNLIYGTIWVDAKDGSIVRIEGTGSKSASMWTGPAHVVRDYARFSGYMQATHARAETDSSLFGKTVVVIDYTDYQVQLTPAK